MKILYIAVSLGSINQPTKKDVKWWEQQVDKQNKETKHISTTYQKMCAICI